VASVQIAEQRGYIWTAKTIAARCQHYAARGQPSPSRRAAQAEANSVLVALHFLKGDLVFDRHLDHPPIPAQIFHPLPAWDPVDAIPCGAPVLGLEPGAEREIGKAQRRARELGRRSQRLHARKGRPRALVADGGTSKTRTLHT